VSCDEARRADTAASPNKEVEQSKSEPRLDAGHWSTADKACRGEEQPTTIRPGTTAFTPGTQAIQRPSGDREAHHGSVHPLVGRWQSNRAQGKHVQETKKTIDHNTPTLKKQPSRTSTNLCMARPFPSSITRETETHETKQGTKKHSLHTYTEWRDEQTPTEQNTYSCLTTFSTASFMASATCCTVDVVNPAMLIRPLLVM